MKMFNTMMEEPLGKQGYGVSEPSCFIAWVILPPQLDRKSYIQKCYQTGSVLIKSVDGQIETYVQVDKGSIHLIQFPLSGAEKGTAVVCVKDPIYRSSKIVGILQDEDDEQTIFEENQWKITKKNNDNYVDIDVKGNTGELDITVGSDEDVESNFKFLSKNKKFKVNWIVQGIYTLETDNEIILSTERKFKILINDTEKKGKEATITYEYEKGLTILDEFENNISTNKDGVFIQTKRGQKFFIDKDGVVLTDGTNDFKTILNSFFDTLSSAVITTPMGPGAFAPNVITQLQKLKAQINALFK